MPAGRLSGETIFTSWRTTVCPGSVELAVAARLACHIDDHRARLHPLDRLGGHEPGRGAPGNQRRRDHDVEALDRVGERLLLAGALLVGELARIASLAARLQAEVEPLRLRATRPARRPRDARHSRSCARRAAWRWRAPADPPRRRPGRAPWPGGIVPAAVISIGKKRPSSSAPSERRAVARDVALGGERVHRLRARDARDRLHRERGRLRVGERPCGGRARERSEKADQDRARAERADLLGVRRRDRHDHVGGPHLARVRRSRTRPPRGRRRRRAARPRPRRVCTRTSRPFAFSFSTTSGTSATRCSPAAVSFGTPIRMRGENVSDPTDERRPGVAHSQHGDREPHPHLHPPRRRRRDPPRRHEQGLQAAPARRGVRDRRRAQRDDRRGPAAAGAARPLHRVAAAGPERPAGCRRRPLRARNGGRGRGRAGARARAAARGPRVHELARAGLRRGQRARSSRCARS